MTPREERGLVIAATQKLTQKGKIWLVPSQTGNGKKYTVHPDSETPFCSCPDFEETGCRCKHLFAVEFTMNRETTKDGKVTETRSYTFTEKKVYQQDWPVYNLAQMEEKRRFLTLLHDLCQGLADPPQSGAGRRRTPMRDMIFTAAYKVYSTFSARRFDSDLGESFEKGYLSKKLSGTMAWQFLEYEMLTPVLKELIKETAKPLRMVETEFAVDSSGFSTSRFIRWHEQKHKGLRSGRDWAKCHLACGVKTHVVTAVIIEDRDAADSPQFAPLVKETRENFDIKEVSADKAYLSVDNVEAVFNAGGTPFIAFKANSTGAAGGPGGLFEKMFHFYSLNKEEYMGHYHKRSNVESVFSMVKAKFRDNLRSKMDVAMKNEVLCKILCHNICCLIMSQLELGIEPVFWGDSKKEEAEIVQPELREVIDMEPATINLPALTDQRPVAREYWAYVGV